MQFTDSQALSGQRADRPPGGACDLEQQRSREALDAPLDGVCLF